VTIQFPNKVLQVPAELRYGKSTSKGGYDICLKVDPHHDLREVDTFDDKHEIESFNGNTMIMPYPFISAAYGGQASKVLPYVEK